ncbi:malate synthase G [Acidomonas methanolica]|uniref:Malate synthase G n=1 Tax=Acidomonas methanolica NBRC 104435 TaxID=1231351 RepID=A0A023D3I9_ACIMT|nr:malate synthase G [Acidomonas methanolica]MBU2654420.1 malate synthase G [Acidomonas methanolica]TCS28510.1 malate synthase [Acidomonas methanolica]GAJ28654.1 malate synthase G [Acidomonas methanolica NBRC 104435]GBQ60251.1 malate synthase G [Acidomonas methanolica]GEK99552.1 malate synthase G [Acidomonas methanolica NBRC 104435]
MGYSEIGGLRVDAGLKDFVAAKVLPAIGLDEAAFWSGFAAIVHDIAPRAREALAVRDRMQEQIDTFLADPANRAPERQDAFLREIGYLEPVPPAFTVSTPDVDEEIATLAGPQLVVPVTNPRYALNAVNARWGSLYDALYGTDAIPREGDLAPGRGYNETRGRAVVARVRAFLDEAAPLLSGSHADATAYSILKGRLHVDLEGGRTSGLLHPDQLVGYQGDAASPSSILLVHNGLHIDIRRSRHSPVGAKDKAGIADVVLESALTTIIDAEDSVSAVDAEDKLLVYGNWLGLIDGSLSAEVPDKDGVKLRKLAEDRVYTAPDGSDHTVSGRSVMLFRSVGWHMFTDAVLDRDGKEIPEGLLDVVLAAAIAKQDLDGRTPHRNSRKGSVYIVRPKQHGSAEVALSSEMFARVESLLGLKPLALKMGIMDEERRTSANLAACLHAAKDRVFFINTGFLDRTGDEIHSCMKAGAVLRKGDMKGTGWIAAYEQRNVAIGLKYGLRGHAQIGKGMWAMPDRMADMLAQKGGQLKAGASTAWVPSPTAATLHALHYHAVDVEEMQAALAETQPRPVTDLLELPLVQEADWSDAERAAELDTNLQGILGYVVRWVDMGIGCSKVPDLNGVGLMEDRATLRISAQHVANWLLHGVISREEVEEGFQRMAKVVDGQNEGEADYSPLAGNGNGPAFRAARELVYEGVEQPNGYTEAILHRRRREAKAKS